LDFADRFPVPLPNLYLQRNQPSEQLPDHYLLDILTNVRGNVIARRIAAYIRHYESGGWDEDEYPVVLLVLDSRKHEAFVQQVLQRALRRANLDDNELTVLTTTKDIFFDASETAIWSAEAIPLTSL